MLIEIAGLPGSGKTMFTKALHQKFAAKGQAIETAVAIAGDAERNLDAPRFVTARDERILLHHYIRFQRAHAQLDARVVETLGKAPQRHLLYAIKAASFQGALDLARPGEIVIMDEGLLSLGVTAFFKANDPAALQKVIALIPPIDALIWVDVPPSLAFERSMQRYGRTPDQRRSVLSKHGNVDNFEVRGALFADAIKRYAEAGVALIRLDAETHSPKALALQAFTEINALAAAAREA